MPRLRRSWVPGAGAHTVSRFIDRRFALVRDADRRRVLDAIENANDRWDWVWLSYALMSSHVHYGHVAGVADPGRFFRSAHTRLAQELHRCTENQTLGRVFAGRPTIHPIPIERLGRLVAYHHRNPVEAGVVVRASQSRWTSHRAYLRLDRAPPWLDVERALDLLGFSDTAAGRTRFDEFVMELNLEDVSWATSTTWRPERRLGRSVGDVDWPRLFEVARQIACVPPKVSLRSKNRAACRARVLIAIVATTDLGQPHAAVAQRLGLTLGSSYNLVSRGRSSSDLESALAELRRRMASE